MRAPPRLARPSSRPALFLNQPWKPASTDGATGHAPGHRRTVSRAGGGGVAWRIGLIRRPQQCASTWHQRYHPPRWRERIAALPVAPTRPVGMRARPPTPAPPSSPAVARPARARRNVAARRWRRPRRRRVLPAAAPRNPSARRARVLDPGRPHRVRRLWPGLSRPGRRDGAAGGGQAGVAGDRRGGRAARGAARRRPGIGSGPAGRLEPPQHRPLPGRW